MFTNCSLDHCIYCLSYFRHFFILIALMRGRLACKLPYLNLHSAGRIPIDTSIFLFANLATSTAVFRGSCLTSAIIGLYWWELVSWRLSLRGFLSTPFLCKNRNLIGHKIQWFMQIIRSTSRMGFPSSEAWIITDLLSIDSCSY